jgi:hypothetical protein
MFPLDRDKNPGMEDVYYLIQKTGCKGWEKEQEWNIRDWVYQQEIDRFEETAWRFKNIIYREAVAAKARENPKVVDMIYMATYNLDKFRRFIFESRFNEVFKLPPERMDKIKSDAPELLTVGLEWIHFGILAERT